MDADTWWTIQRLRGEMRYKSNAEIATIQDVARKRQAAIEALGGGHVREWQELSDTITAVDTLFKSRSVG